MERFAVSHIRARVAFHEVDWLEAFGQAAAVVVSAAAWGWLAWRLFAG